MDDHWSGLSRDIYYLMAVASLFSLLSATSSVRRILRDRAPTSASALAATYKVTRPLKPYSVYFPDILYTPNYFNKNKYSISVPFLSTVFKGIATSHYLCKRPVPFGKCNIRKLSYSTLAKITKIS
jgi:hypothetical protein